MIDETIPAETIPAGYCQCGCGQKTTIAPQSHTRLGYIKGEPLRYVRGHGPHTALPLEVGACFGHLVVLASGRPFGPRTVICACDCGETKEVIAQELRRGRVRSCGCRRWSRKTPPLAAGARYGRLAVVEMAGVNGRNDRLYVVRCDCGTIKVASHDALRSGNTRSCGCVGRATHGMTGTSTYRSWTAMLRRCTNTNDQAWPDYGGRGITVCDRWRDSFAAFLEDMGLRPDWANGGIDRIDNNGGYEPANCRWATAKQQANNKRPRTRKEAA